MHDNAIRYPNVDSVLAVLDPEVCPQAFRTLSEISEMLEDEDGGMPDPHEAATELVHADMPDDLPEELIELIEELYLCAAENGDADAWNDLGAQYYDGARGFPQDFGKALHYYELAAENGSRQAQENLGYCYYYGRSVPVDYEKAFHYFLLGALDGHIISLYKIGDMYRNGYYVKKNGREAFIIYDHCVDIMSDEAAKFCGGPLFLRLGDCWLNGIGTEKNAKNALVCYHRAETYLYDMVANGEVMYRKSLEAAVEGQNKAREALSGTLPDKRWTFDG